MKLLDKLVLKDLVPQLLIGVSMFTLLYFALGPLLAASRFLSQGIPLWVVIKFVVFNTTSVLGQTFPMGMLLAVLLGLGRLSADSETVALFAGGIPFIRIAWPAAVLGLIVSVLGYIVNDPVASYAAHQIVNMRASALHQKSDTDQGFPVPDYRAGGVLQATVHVEKGFSAQTQAMRQVTITLYNASGQPSALFYARSAHPAADNLSSKEWQLDDVDVYTLGQNVFYSHYDHLSSHEDPRLKNTGLTSTAQTLALFALLQKDPNALPFKEDRKAIAAFKASGLGHNPDARTAEFTLWTKISLPLASLIFTLLGAPLALRPQRTSRLTGWLLALPIIMGYYVLYTVMGSIARGGACPPLLAAFLPDLVGAVVGVIMIWKRTV